MKRRTLVQTCARGFLTLCTVVLARFILLMLGAILDLPNTEAQDVADDSAHAVTEAQLRAKVDAVALSICIDEVGPGATLLWTHQGDMVCRPDAHLVAKGGAL